MINWELGQLGLGKMVEFRTGVMLEKENSTKFLSIDTLRIVFESSVKGQHIWGQDDLSAESAPGKTDRTHLDPFSQEWFPGVQLFRLAG